MFIFFGGSVYVLNPGAKLGKSHMQPKFNTCVSGL
jgi:hypothetical protein